MAPLIGGLVHDTFVVSDGPRRFILQQVNTAVFKDPYLGVKNIEVVTQHLSADPNYDLEVPQLVLTKDGDALVHDQAGGHWRCLSFIEDSHVRPELGDPADAYEVARAFGKFSASLSQLDPNRLAYTIPDFHNPVSRLHQFKQARMSSTKEDSDTKALLRWSEEYMYVARAMESLKWPLKVAHNDAKMSNVLFDAADRPLSIIDLDTVMPGSALHDFGDLVRSMASSTEEDDPNYGDVEIRQDVYQALRQGFINGCQRTLTDGELQHLELGAGYIILEQAIRFLTDHLNGNIYYQVTYPEHNLVRATNQLTLLQSFLKQRDLDHL